MPAPLDVSTGDAGEIVALIAVILAGILVGMMLLGLVLMNCCGTASCGNLFWRHSDAQQRLVAAVGRRKLRVGAHRGGSINAPENTLSAFAAAVRSGAGLLELDLNLSKDGVPIVSHDFELRRVIDPAWLRAHPECKTVSDCLSTDLPPLAESIDLHFNSPTRTRFSAHAPRSDHPAEKSFDDSNNEGAAATAAAAPASAASSGKEIFYAQVGADAPRDAWKHTRFCTLQELLDVVPPEVALHIDIKQADAEGLLVRRTLELIAAHPRSRAAHTIVLGAASPTNSRRLLRAIGRARGCECCDESTCCCCGQLAVSCCCCACCSCGVPPAASAGPAGSGREPLLVGETRPLVFANVFGVIATQLLFWTGLLPWVNIPFDVYSVPGMTTTLRDSWRQRGGDMCCADYLLAFVGCFLTTPKLWAYLRSRGIVVFVWVLNDNQGFKEASEWPIDGVMTDDVPLLTAFCEREKAFMRDPGQMV